MAVAMSRILLFLLPGLAEAYRARVVAANPVVPKGCADRQDSGDGDDGDWMVADLK